MALIYIIEDDDSIREIEEFALQNAGHKVYGFACAKDFYKKMEEVTAISGYAELLEGGMVGEEKQKHFYQEIRKNANRLLALITDIINLSELDRKDSSLIFEEINLYEVASECMNNLSVNAKLKGVSIELGGEKGTVNGNKELLKELIENLAQNAIRYNNPGGKVYITIKSLDGRTSLIVEDNGIGIPIDQQDRVFERFYRVDKSRSRETGGTGLGLAIVKHIADIHAAEIKLSSALGEGTTITVSF